MKRALLASLAMTAAWGCTGANLGVQARRLPDGAIRYEGELAGPHDTFAQLVKTACGGLTAQRPTTPGEGAPHLGYCAGYFYSPEDKAFFISHISPMVGSPGSEERTCAIPRNLLDPDNTKEVVSLGGADHPPSERIPSGLEERGEARWRPTRFFNQETLQPHDRDLLVLDLKEPGSCAVYGYDHFRRIITAQQANRFVVIGRVTSDEALTSRATP
ncbi:hypothetical protein F0U61_08855 [Archangium violaceum]|uniref:hypothetical protein n=1 Tax=Archangium violaceum TaxID=83451 RepID=UPI002B290169|nr:hypothetical protein F0U61_08855 [Archangium violaceum]